MNNENNDFKISNKVSFPSQLDSFETKKTTDWGLSVAKAIEAEWFYRGVNGNNNCKFYTTREDFVKRRLYAKGQQGMSKYFEQLGLNGDKSYLNLTKQPITLIPKLVNVVANGMSNRGYAIRAFAIDPASNENRLSYRQNIQKDMVTKDFLQEVKNQLNVDLSTMPLDKLPQNQTELDLHMQYEYKQSIEISEELAIETVLQENKYTDIIEKRVLKDLVTCGVAWVRNRFVKNKGIVTEYVDVENKIQSETDNPYFEDCFYHGEFKTVLISELMAEFPEIANNESIKRQLENQCVSWWNYHRTPADQRLTGTSNILYFTYKTTRTRAKKIKEKKSGERVVSKASEQFDSTQVSKLDFKRVEVQEEVLFEGVYVLGTNILLKWEVSEYMARPKSNKQKVVDQYIGIAPEKEKTYINSLVERMIPIEDQIQICRLKTLQIIQRILPDGYEIDVDGIVSLDFGDGNAYTEQNILDMFFQTGSMLVRGYGSTGEFNSSKRILQELRTSGSLEKLNALRLEIENLKNEMRDVIGLNKASDASTPDKDSLVGIQKLAALNSNTATRHILDGFIYITKYTAEAITYRISDLLKYSDLKQDFIRKIGSTSVENLEYVKNLHLHDFAIYLDLAPDDEERAKLEADLSDEINKGAIGVEDKYTILNIKNLKYAVAYLGILKKRKAKEDEERKAREFEMQTQSNIQSAQAAEQAKQQTLQLELQVKSAIQELVNNGIITKEQAKGQEDRLTEELKAKNKLELQYVINQGLTEKQSVAEDRKDERSVKEATMESEKIKQRQDNGDPIDFEEKENKLKIFDTTNLK